MINIVYNCIYYIYICHTYCVYTASITYIYTLSIIYKYTLYNNIHNKQLSTNYLLTYERVKNAKQNFTSSFTLSWRKIWKVIESFHSLPCNTNPIYVSDSLFAGTCWKDPKPFNERRIKTKSYYQFFLSVIKLKKILLMTSRLSYIRQTWLKRGMYSITAMYNYV